jgi:hypothetical protein
VAQWKCEPNAGSEIVLRPHAQVSTKNLLYPSLPAAAVGSRVAANSWKGILRDASAHALGGATVSLQSASGASYSAKTSASGEFLFADIPAQRYQVAVALNGKFWKATDR